MTTPIKQQRTDARILIKADPYVQMMVEEIIRTGRCDGKSVLTWLHGRIKAMDNPDMPKLTLTHWETAKELSDLFKIVERKPDTKARPLHDYAGGRAGALNIIKSTGYVWWKTSSPIWMCECMFCKRVIHKTSHELNHKLAYCGERNACHEGLTCAKEWRANKNKVFVLSNRRNLPRASADEVTEMMINNLGPVSTEIH